MDLLLTVCMMITSWWTLSEAGQGSTAGIQVMISKSGLAHINKFVVDDIFGDLKNHKFPSQSGDSGTGSLSFSFSDIHTSDVKGLTSDIKLLPGVGLHWGALVDVMKVTTHYAGSYEVDLWLGPVQKVSVGGSLTSEVRDISAFVILDLDVTSSGTLSTSVRYCNTTVTTIDLDFAGSIMDWVLEQMTDFFDPDIKELIEKEICNAVEFEIKRTSEHLQLDNIKTSVSLTIMDIPVTMDYGLKGLDIGDDYIATFHKGDFSIKGDSLRFLLSTNKFPDLRRLSSVQMFGLSLREEIINHLLQSLGRMGLLNGGLNINNVVAKYKPLFQASCTDSTSGCLGMYFPEAVQLLEAGVLQLKMEIHRASLSVKTNSAVIKADGRLRLQTVDGKFNTVVSGEMHLVIPLQFGVQDNIIVMRALSVSGRLAITTSKIGKVLDDENSKILRRIKKQLIETFIQNINAMKTAFPIPLPSDIGLKDISVSLLPGIIHIGGNMCYRDVPCPNSLLWTGKDLHESQKGFQIVDETINVKSGTGSSRLRKKQHEYIISTGHVAGIAIAVSAVIVAIVVVGVALLIYRHKKRDVADIVAYDNTVQTGVGFTNPGYAETNDCGNIPEDCKANEYATDNGHNELQSNEHKVTKMHGDT